MCYISSNQLFLLRINFIMQKRNMGVWTLDLSIPHEENQKWYFDTKEKAEQVFKIVKENVSVFPKHPMDIDHDAYFASTEEVRERLDNDYWNSEDEFFNSLTPNLIQLNELKSMFYGVVKSGGELTVRELVLDIH
jgi:hypothetical protein